MVLATFDSERWFRGAHLAAPGTGAGGRAGHSVRAVNAENQLNLGGLGVVGGAHGVPRPTVAEDQMAAVSSCCRVRRPDQSGGVWRVAFTTWFSICLGLFGIASQIPGRASAAEAAGAAYAKKNFREAELRYKAGQSHAKTAWEFGRACFDLADFATNRTERALIAEQGILACRQAVAREPNLAPGHYYLGMNLAQLAQTKGLSALKLVSQMEQEFSLARTLDEQFDFAGPDRNLGLLYRDAPAIGSIGSRSKAREHLKRAVALVPQYPENRLNLIEAYLKWGERNNAHRELQALEEAWLGARTNFIGEAWTAGWADWEPRLNKLKKKLEASQKPLGAPREKN